MSEEWFKRRFKDIWELNFSGNINYSRYSDESDLLFGDNTIENFNYNLFLNNILTLSKKKNLIAFVIFRYNSPFEDFASQRTNGLFRSDIGLRKTYSKFSLSLFFNDIFNSYNRNITEFRTFQSGLVNSVTKDELTQSISLNLRYNFGNNKLKQLKEKKIGNQDIKNRID